jgi:hypothetical protein
VVLADPSMLIPTEARGSSPFLRDDVSPDGLEDASRGLPLWTEGNGGASPYSRDLRNRRSLRQRRQGGGKAGGERERGGQGQDVQGISQSAVRSSGSSKGRGEEELGGGVAVSNDAQAIAAAALDEIIKAESQGANRTRRSRSKKKDQQ